MTEEVDFSDITPEDFEEDSDGLFFVYDRLNHSFLSIFPKGDTEEEKIENRTLCLFNSKEDAEECIVGWGFDPEGLVTFELEDDQQLLFFLWSAARLFHLYTVNPPVSSGYPYSCYRVEDLLDYAQFKTGV